MPANIVGLPDYDDTAYNEPNYEYNEASYDANRARYTNWRRLWAKRHFHESYEDYDPHTPDKPLIGIIDLLHHPSFPAALHQKLISSSNDEEPLHPVDVKDFMENKYAHQLEKPDWDYLKEIISNLEEEGPSPIPQTVRQARHWLEAKRTTILMWPPMLGEPDAKGRKERLKDVFAFERVVKAGPKFQGKLDDLIRLPLTLASLLELLSNLRLVEEHDSEGTIANPYAKAGEWGGLVLALHKKQLLVGPASSIYKALKSSFKAKVSEKTISNALRGDGYQSIYHAKIVLNHLETMPFIT
ncbi:hypothetical protein GCM10028822_30330 [Hymenobacter terrigena]